MRDKLKVLFLPTATSGVVWHRMFQFFKFMREDPTMNPAMDKFDPDRATPYEWQFPTANRNAILGQIEKLVGFSQVVVMQYLLTDYGVAITRGLKKIFPEKPIVVEIDDYCLEINHYSPASKVYLPGNEAPESVIAHIAEADMLIVSTPYLKKLYTPYNKNIQIIRNCIDFDLWDKLVSKEKDTKRLRFGWVGAATHSEDLRFIEKPIERILEKYPFVEFMFGGGTPGFLVKKHDRILSDNIWHNVYKYPQSLKDRNVDIGLAPLLDNNFNRAKSNLRWLEYSALKIPTICSKVGHFKDTLKTNDTAILCSEPDEWFEAMSLLIENETLRKQIGINAYNEVKKNFNIKVISKKYTEILKGIYYDAGRTENKNKVDDARGRHKDCERHECCTSLK